MENQSKVIVIERNKFAALVKSHRKCLQMLNILTYIYTVKEVSLTLTLQEICEVLHMTPEEVEIQRQKGYIRFTTQKGMTQSLPITLLYATLISTPLFFTEPMLA